MPLACKRHDGTQGMSPWQPHESRRPVPGDCMLQSLHHDRLGGCHADMDRVDAPSESAASEVAGLALVLLNHHIQAGSHLPSRPPDMETGKPFDVSRKLTGPDEVAKKA